MAIKQIISQAGRDQGRVMFRCLLSDGSEQVLSIAEINARSGLKC